MDNINLLELTCTELTALFSSRYGKGAYHSQPLYRAFLKNGNTNVTDLPEFIKSPGLIKKLNLESPPSISQIIKVIKDQNTHKFVTKLHDGYRIESVIIPMKHYNTLCISSQVGCRMGCRFCSTAGQGFKRNLSVSEITGQLYTARFILKKDIQNIVFMGMGEPLDNFKHVIQAIHVINDQRGFDIALRHITLSTCGLIPAIQDLVQQNMPQLNLAVSVNAADDEKRSALMPVNNKYPLPDLMKTLKQYPLKNRKDIRGFNDSEEDADNLYHLLKHIKARVNLIPYNPGPGLEFKAPSDRDVHRFGEWLSRKGLFVIKRWSKGQNLMAACGQLTGNPVL